MAFLHHSGDKSPVNTTSNPGSAPGSAGLGSGKRRMSLFSFGHGMLTPSSAQTKNRELPALSTSPSSGNASITGASKLPLVRSPRASFLAKMNPLLSPGIGPVLETDSLSENPSLHIFERSVQDMSGLVKQEDCIPPALDATAQILSDLAADLDNVEMVYSLRRNLSVIGLNMALGRPYTPLRKNSMYLASHGNLAEKAAHLSLSSLNYSQPPFASQNPPTSAQNQTQLPVSPPKLMSSRSLVSFYLYADMLNNDEFLRRPLLMHAYSHGVVPTVGRKMSVALTHSGGPTFTRERSASEFSKFPRKSVQPTEAQLQLLKQFARSPKNDQETIGEDTPLKRFLISPELSDSEDQEEVFHPALSSRRPMSRRKSVALNASFANSLADNDSFVSSSVGDCIRQCTTEIGNN